MELLAEKAADPRFVDVVDDNGEVITERRNRPAGRLVKGLGVRDADVRQASHEALVALGPAALDELIEAVDGREPYAQAAVRTVGSIGEPSTFLWLDELSRDTELHQAAEVAFDHAEQALWKRISTDPTLELCDQYLEWFERGAHAREVEEARDGLQAWESLLALGEEPSEAQLIGHIERYPGTKAEFEARRMLADRYLRTAEFELAAGRPDTALARVNDAKRWAPDRDTSEVEARVRAGLGRKLAERNDIDAAIHELALSVELGGDEGRADLGRLYLMRSDARFSRGDLVGGMVDLTRAREAAPTMRDSLTQNQQARVEELFNAVKSGAANRDQAAGALAVSGVENLDRLRAAVLERLALGDPQPLQGAGNAGLRADAPDATKAWIGGLLDEALNRTQSNAMALLNDGSQLEAMLRPAQPWAPATAATRDAVAGLLAGYEVAVELAQRYVASGGQLSTAVPDERPRSAQELSLELFHGRRPSDGNLGVLLRVQLLRHTLDAATRLEELARKDPARLALQFVGRTTLPADMVEWAVLADDAYGRIWKPSYPVPLPDGSAGEMRSVRSGGTLRIELRVPPRGGGVSDGVLSDGLTAILGSARLLFAADPALERVEVAIGMGQAPNWVLSNTVQLAIRRGDLERMDWVNIERSTPFMGRRHLGLVPSVTGG